MGSHLAVLPSSRSQLVGRLTFCDLQDANHSESAPGAQREAAGRREGDERTSGESTTFATRSSALPFLSWMRVLEACESTCPPTALALEAAANMS